MSSKHKCHHRIAANSAGTAFRNCSRSGTVKTYGFWYCSQHDPATLAERRTKKLRRQEKRWRERGKKILNSVVKENTDRCDMCEKAMEHIKTAAEGSVYHLWVQVKMLFDPSCKFSIQDRQTEQQFELLRLALLDIKIEDIYDETYTKEFLKQKEQNS